MDTELQKQNQALTVAENGQNQALAPTLTTREQHLVKATRSGRCVDLIRQGPEVVLELTKAIHKMQAITGQVKSKNADDTTQMQMIDAMLDVVKRYKWLRIDELRFIIKEGMIGEYGEVYGFNALNLNTWIKTYYDNERGKALKKQLEFDNKQATIEEEIKKAKEMEDAYTFNRRSFIDTYHLLQIKHEEAIKDTSLQYSDIPEDVDRLNGFFYAFQKKWDKFLGFERELFDKVLQEELTREKSRAQNDGNWVKARSEEALINAAKSNARSRVFRMRLALMLMQEENIEEFFNQYGI